jgi:OOP family OmpA-OmpF porin
MSKANGRVLGLIPLAGLVLLAGLWRQGGIEADLGSRAAERAAPAAAWAKVEASGRDIVLSGEAPAPEAQRAAVAAADGVFGVRRVIDATILPPESRPFILTALRDGAKLTLTGHVPPGEARAALLGAAKLAMPGTAIVDELKTARGAPGDFSAIAAFGLAQLGRLGEGTMSISDQALSLSGRAADFPGHAALKAALANPPGGLRIAKGLGPGDILPPPARPFTFAVERSDSEISLSGFVPSEAARARLIADARAQGLQVRDGLIHADGAPSGDWGGAASLLVREMARLDPGRAGLADDKAAISGRGRDLVTEQDIRDSLKALPQGFSLVKVEIESRAIRPYRFEASRGEGVLILSGHVPDSRAKADILDVARRYFEGDRIEDRLAEGLGEPKDFLAAARAGLQELSRLAPGASFSLADAAASLKGLALFDAARDQIGAAFRQTMPPAFRGSVEVATAPLPPPIADPRECQMLYQGLLSRGTIRFRSGSAELSDESRGLLDRLTVVSMRCTEARLEIAGHTDSDGNPQSNAELSRRRAESVAVYLVRAGIAPARLEPAGYGQTVPVAPNDTPENKAKNRRIEFVVK